jgi:hypothetical protein
MMYQGNFDPPNQKKFKGKTSKKKSQGEKKKRKENQDQEPGRGGVLCK